MHRNITNRIAQLAIGPLALLLLTLPGCKSEDSLKLFGPGNGQEQVQQPKVTFDLPEGWNWTDETHEIAIKGEAPPFATEGPFEMVKSIGIIKQGDEEEAKKLAQKDYEEMMARCNSEENACIVSPVYEEITINDEVLYVAKQALTAFYEPPDFGWWSYVYFTHNGNIMVIDLYEDPTAIQNELAHIIKTLQY